MQQTPTHHGSKIRKEYALDYCAIQVRDDDIVVFEFQDSVNVDAEMVAELTQLADENMDGPFGVLSNRIHSYSLSFDAMSAVAQYDNMAAVAIVVHSAKSRALVETQNFFISALKKKPIKIFLDTDSAIAWLHATLPPPATTTNS